MFSPEYFDVEHLLYEHGEDPPHVQEVEDRHGDEHRGHERLQLQALPEKRFKSYYLLPFGKCVFVHCFEGSLRLTAQFGKWKCLASEKRKTS